MAKLIHGSAHASTLILEVDSFDDRGQPHEPALLLLNSAGAIRDDAVKCREVAEVLGPEAVRVIRGPLYASMRGEDIPQATVCALVLSSRLIPSSCDNSS